jgi:psp operon transcriptional activator
VAAATPQTDEPATITPAVPAAHEFPIDLKQSVQDYEIGMIKSALAASQFNQKKTADALGVTYHQLRGLLKKYDLLDQ